jgi:hypothetical protein
MPGLHEIGWGISQSTESSIYDAANVCGKRMLTWAYRRIRRAY